MRNSKPVKTGP